MAKYLVQHRRGTATQWAEKNTVIPREGEIVIEIDDAQKLHKLKIGDGVTPYADLKYLMAGDEIVTQVLAEAKPRVITVNLTTNWSVDGDKYKQELALTDITKYSRLDLQPDVDMLAEFKQLGLVFVTENKEGVITVYAVGEKPNKAYSIQATIVETDGADTKVVGMPVGASAAQSDWNQTDETKADFIKNKPLVGATPIKNINQSKGSVQISANVVNVFPPLTGRIELTFASAQEGLDNEWAFVLPQGATAWTVVHPEIEWYLGIAPSFEANSTTEVRVHQVGDVYKGVWIV